MIGGGTGKESRCSKHASSYDGKSPEEIRQGRAAGSLPIIGNPPDFGGQFSESKRYLFFVKKK